MANSNIFNILLLEIEARSGHPLKGPDSKGWYRGGSPLRDDRNGNSFTVMPDDGASPGGYRDHATGDRGSLRELAKLMGVDLHAATRSSGTGTHTRTSPRPRVQAPVVTVRNVPPSLSADVDAWFSARSLDRVLLAKHFGPFRPLRRDDRPAFAFPSVPGLPERLRFVDGAKGKTKVMWFKTAGGTACAYGLSIALKHAGKDGPLYIVNGEPSVWACGQSGVGAICTCAGETNPPKPELLQTIITAAAGRPIRVVYDRDDVGRKGADALVDSFRAQGAVDVRALDLPDDLPDGGDVDDLHRRVGDAGLAAALMDLPPRPRGPTDGGGGRVSAVTPGASRITVVVKGGGDETPLPVLVDSCVPGLSRCDRFYRRCFDVVMVEHADETMVQLRKIERTDVRRYLEEHVHFVKARSARQGAPVENLVGAPDDLCRYLVSNPTWHAPARIRPLLGVSATPFLRADGTVASKEHYDAASKYYIASGLGEVDVPERPTREDALRAVKMLRELVDEVPWASEDDFAAWLACVLTPFVRPGMKGPCPVLLVIGNRPGVGKTRLVQIASLIATGRSAAPEDLPADRSELDTRLLSIAMSGAPIMFLDNLRGKIGSPRLESVLTSELVRGRPLYSNAMSEQPWRTIIWATSNDVELSDDIYERSVVMELRSEHDNPRARTGFRIENVEGAVRARRKELVEAALTILRAFATAGSPRPLEGGFGSFQEWSDRVRQCVGWVNGRDPLAARRRLLSRLDPGREAVSTMIRLWPAGSGLSAKDIVNALGDDATPVGDDEEAWREAMRLVVDDDRRPLSARIVGRRLPKHDGITVEGRTFRCTKDESTNSNRFSVESAADAVAVGGVRGMSSVVIRGPRQLSLDSRKSGSPEVDLPPLGQIDSDQRHRTDRDREEDFLPSRLGLQEEPDFGERWGDRGRDSSGHVSPPEKGNTSGTSGLPVTDPGLSQQDDLPQDVAQWPREAVMALHDDEMERVSVLGLSSEDAHREAEEHIRSTWGGVGGAKRGAEDGP